MREQTVPYHLLRNGRWPLLGCCFWLCQCVQVYVSPYKSPATGYLVVEGYISGNSPTQFSLSRTIPLPGDSTIPVVTGAEVQVEGTDSSVYPLTEQGNGQYGVASLPLSTAVQYRLRVSIPNGETYLSGFVPYKSTPPIDSVNWVYNASTGVTIFVNTHDPTNSTRYYQWNYDQTYEYHSAEASEYIYLPANDSFIPRTPAQETFSCWKDVLQTSILVGTSAQLAQDQIYEFPLVNIPPNTQPLSVEYSILVSQYSLTDSGYTFLSLMRQNTESLGSIFDVQPSEITGNIHSLSNPTEPVIGYISAGTVQQQRIFINRLQLPYWSWLFTCDDPDKIVPPILDSLEFYFDTLHYIPLYQNFGPNPPLFGWFANMAYCVDCTLQGGTNQKPNYWPTN
jgi:hypothetical protein